MQFLTVISAAILATSAIAAPTPNAEATAPAPVVATTAVKPLIDLWFEPDFLDIKFTGKAQVGECKNFQKENNNVFSSGKAKPGFRCTIWVDHDCNGTGFSFNTKGSAKFPKWIDNKASSWKCVDAES